LCDTPYKTKDWLGPWFKTLESSERLPEQQWDITDFTDSEISDVPVLSRWQSETTNSMIKRNLGSAMRPRTTVGRRHELLLRVLTHNIMLLAEG